MSKKALNEQEGVATASTGPGPSASGPAPAGALQSHGTVIQVQIRSVYGRDLIYPVNQAAKDAVRLTARSTFTKPDLTTLRDLGFRIEFISSYLELD